tara:strand:+ start:347 stop:562 length:216 start_codon:yes stop_codon:yes gene_type:complete
MSEQQEYNELVSKVFDLDEQLDKTIDLEISFAYPSRTKIKRAASNLAKAQEKLKQLDVLIHKIKGIPVCTD